MSTLNNEDLFVRAFEKLWIDLRARWCDSHDIGTALFFSHPQVKIPFFHRVVRVDVDESGVDALIDEAIRFFGDKEFDCIFTLSPLDRPANLAEHLLRRGFTESHLASAMVYEAEELATVQSVARVEVSGDDSVDIWAKVMCRSFGYPPAMGEAGCAVLTEPQTKRYLAYIGDEPAGTTMLYSQDGMGYIDLVGTLPEHRRKGVASALVRRAVEDSMALGNRWHTLECITGSDAERIYQRLGFRVAYHRRRFIKETLNFLRHKRIAINR